MSEAEINDSFTDSFLAKRSDFLRCFARLLDKVMHKICLREYVCPQQVALYSDNGNP